MMKALLKMALVWGLVSLADYTAMAQTQSSACPPVEGPFDLLQVRPRTGCPLSAVIEITHTQTLADGTHVQTKSKMLVYELKLDVYRPTTAKAPTPVVMMIHGGGWVRDEKEEEVLSLLPYLEMGWAAVNVEYRLARISLAPAAVEHCRCALHWIGRNANKYNFDVSKVVVTGASAGGHLALTTAMIPASAGFDNGCVSQDDPKWSGPWTDPTPNVGRS